MKDKQSEIAYIGRTGGSEKRYNKAIDELHKLQTKLNELKSSK